MALDASDPDRIAVADATSVAQLLTPPSTHPSSPEPVEQDEAAEENLEGAPTKKKKKKKAKKKAKTAAGAPAPEDTGPPPLCISRNKHWRYISSYHGPWLQLPIELLESLMVVNMDPTALGVWTDARSPHSPSVLDDPTGPLRLRDHAYIGDAPRSPSPRSPGDAPRAGSPPPPPVDPGVFHAVTSIRRLVDEASELAVRASAGVGSAPAASPRGPGGWMAGGGYNYVYGTDPNSLYGGAGGRTLPLSATRIHRLRALAVQKLAAAYKLDEVAASVMVMQGGSVFDDIAQRVLRHDPHDVDAKYVHFFHEKIPSRQLAEHTTPALLDELIAAEPHRLEFFRTRGLVHTFRDAFTLAARDFTHALKEARSQRKARALRRLHAAHPPPRKPPPPGFPRAPSPDDDGGGDGPTGPPVPLHPSAGPDAPDPLEPQCLFLRGGAHLAHAAARIEAAALALEGVPKTRAPDGTDLRLSALPGGRLGGVERAHPGGPLGAPRGPKAATYRSVLGAPRMRAHVNALARKALRDFERFLAHFDARARPRALVELERSWPERAAAAFALCDARRPGGALGAGARAAVAGDAPPALLTTYHPLLVEAHFSVLLCRLLLGEFGALLPAFVHAADVLAGLDGYPVFLPPRSLAQAEFLEVLDRLAAGWRHGTRPHSLACDPPTALVRHGKGVAPPPMPIVTPPSPPLSAADSALAELRDDEDEALPSSSSRAPSRRPSHLLEDPETAPEPVDLRASLDAVRMLLVPVVHRRKEQAEQAAQERQLVAAGGEPPKPALQIPLHGPRVDIILAWLGAVHLPELDEISP